MPEAADVEETDEEWEPDLDAYETAAEIVREAGENALLFGLCDLYEATRLRSRVLCQWPAPKPDVTEGSAEDVAEASDEIAQEAAEKPVSPLAPLSGHEAGLPYTAEYAPAMISIENAKMTLGHCLAAANDLIAQGTYVSPVAAPVPPAAMPSQEEAAKLAQVQRLTTEEKQALAVGLLAKHPDWSLQRIADSIGVSRRTLYNWPQFRMAHRLTRAKDPGAIPKGFKTKMEPSRHVPRSTVGQRGI